MGTYGVKMGKNGLFWGKIVDFWAFLYIIPNTFIGENNTEIYVIFI